MKAPRGSSSGEPDIPASAGLPTSNARSSSAQVAERASTGGKEGSRLKQKASPPPSPRSLKRSSRSSQKRNPTTKGNTKGAKASKALGTASLVGWHMIQDARLCEWRFYLKNVLGLRPSFYARALLFGQAFHAGKALFYERGLPKGGSNAALVKASVEAGEILLHDVRDLYENSDEYAQDVARVGPLLEVWARTQGLGDLASWKVLEVEREHRLPVGESGYFMTIRPDAVLGREDEIRVMETKTSGFSVQSAIWGVETGGQVLAYVEGVRRAYPKAKRVVMVPDVAFWRKGNLEPRNIVCERGRPLSPSPEDTQVFLEEVEATLRAVSEKTALLFARGGEKPHTLFPRVREPGVCTAYARPCEYWEACRLSPRPGDRVFGYTWDLDKVKTYKKEITK